MFVIVVVIRVIIFAPVGMSGKVQYVARMDIVQQNVGVIGTGKIKHITVTGTRETEGFLFVRTICERMATLAMSSNAPPIPPRDERRQPRRAFSEPTTVSHTIENVAIRQVGSNSNQVKNITRINLTSDPAFPPRPPHQIPRAPNGQPATGQRRPSAPLPPPNEFRLNRRMTEPVLHIEEHLECFEDKFRFHDVDDFPEPDDFLDLRKTYMSRNRHTSVGGDQYQRKEPRALPPL
ncbi:hypothetical protein ScPMuIL_011318 [Solemya velum]